MTACGGSHHSDSPSDTNGSYSISKSWSWKGDGTDLCTEQTGDTCYMQKIQIDLVSDDTWQVSYNWFHTTINGSDTIVSDSNYSQLIPVNKDSYLLVDRFVFRGSGEDRIFWLKLFGDKVPYAQLVTFQGDDLNRESDEVLKKTMTLQ